MHAPIPNFKQRAVPDIPRGDNDEAARPQAAPSGTR